jgi:asparagine synthase (glutamine-hydrolysing)
VPKELLDRPKKGFGVPLRKWLRTVLKDEIAHYADKDILKRQDIFDGDAVQTLILKQENSDKIMYSSMLWSFYVFQKWYQMYIEDLW